MTTRTLIYDDLMRSLNMSPANFNTSTVPPNAPLLMAEEARTGGGTADLIRFDDYLRNNYTLSQLSELADNAKFLHERAALIAAEFEREGPRVGSPATEPAHAYAPSEPPEPFNAWASSAAAAGGQLPDDVGLQEPASAPAEAGETEGTTEP